MRNKNIEEEINKLKEEIDKNFFYINYLSTHLSRCKKDSDKVRLSILIALKILNLTYCRKVLKEKVLSYLDYVLPPIKKPVLLLNA